MELIRIIPFVKQVDYGSPWGIQVGDGEYWHAVGLMVQWILETNSFQQGHCPERSKGVHDVMSHESYVVMTSRMYLLVVVKPVLRTTRQYMLLLKVIRSCRPQHSHMPHFYFIHALKNEGSLRLTPYNVSNWNEAKKNRSTRNCSAHSPPPKNRMTWTLCLDFQGITFISHISGRGGVS